MASSYRRVNRTASRCAATLTRSPRLPGDGKHNRRIDRFQQQGRSAVRSRSGARAGGADHVATDCHARVAAEAA
jgi:hypothetical protein